MQDSRKRSKALALKKICRSRRGRHLLAGWLRSTNTWPAAVLCCRHAQEYTQQSASLALLQMTNSEQLDTFEVATDAWRMQGLEGGAGVYGGRRLERQTALEQRGPSRRGETTTGPNEARMRDADGS
ncbi:unnamed protein product [Urochloa humidicola]